jgi:D-lyxose ketol-isomerase
MKKNNFTIVSKTWGYEKVYYNENYCYKDLHLNANSKTSLHRHINKKETFVPKDNGLKLEYVDSLNELSYIINLEADISYTLEPMTWHRVHNDTNAQLILREISTHHEDSDVERINKYEQ